MTGQVAASGSSSLRVETTDILAEAIQAHGLAGDDDTFEYHPETFDNLEMDVRAKTKSLPNLRNKVLNLR